MACALALFGATPALSGGVLAAGAGPEMLADATGVGMPSYSYHALNAARASGLQPAEFAALYVDGYERGDGIAMQGEGASRHIAIDVLLAALALTPRRGDGVIAVDTPLGEAQIDLAACRTQDVGLMCAMSTVAAALAIEIVFDSGEFALRVRTAWPQPATGSDDPAIPVDVEAPDASLSYARSQFGVYDDGRETRFLGTGEVGGGLGNGFWRSSWFQDSSGRRGLYDYAWIAQRDRSRLLLGHQVMGLDPLLPSFDLLGAQGVWTNRPDAVFGGSTEQRRLVSDRFAPNRTLRGEGPPGGRAELRVDEQLIDSVTIPLSGRYVFDGVQLADAQLASVQVLLYERAFDTVPIRVEDRSFSSSDRLLGSGTAVQFAGVGVQDNPLGDSRLRDGIDGEAAGFYQARIGVSDQLSLEGAVQRSQEGDYVLAGAHLSTGGSGVASVLLARNERGEQGMRLQADGQRRRWFWRGFAQQEDAGYREPGRATERTLRYAESGWMGNRWMLSLLARQERGGPDQREVDYVKPALSAQISHDLSLSVRPDSEGDYGYLARWAPIPHLYVSAFRDSLRDQAEVNWSLPHNTRLIGGWVRDELSGERRSLLAYRDAGGARRWRYGAGVLESEGDFGWLMEAGAGIGSGMYFSAQATDDPLGGDDSGTTLWLNLSIDLVNTGSGFARASYRSDYSRNGSISGRLRLPGNSPPQSLAQVPILIDGMIRAHTDAGGAFHVAGLAPGVYRVQVDEENLPFDLAPAQRQLGVEVAAGRATPVGFALTLRLGAAGRVLDADGRALKNSALRVIDIAAGTTTRVYTDGHGYFRLSGLAPGRYRIALDADSARAGREIELVDRYLFDQDLVLEP